MPREQMIRTLAVYPSITNLSRHIAFLDAEPSSDTFLPIKLLLDLCHHLSRDLNYVVRLQEETQSTLDSFPAYQSEWISDVRIAASDALRRADSYITSKIPNISDESTIINVVGAKSTRSKVKEILNDSMTVAAIERLLSVVHSSVIGVVAVMHKMALQNSDLVSRGVQSQRAEISRS
ncbi:hypothetical protein SCUP515_12523 [Seiridium cupressi]